MDKPAGVGHLQNMKKDRLNRILIVGDSCRGKSTLAERISKKLGIQNHSTDDYYYELKFSKIRDKKESIDLILNVFKKEQWIIEGATRHLIEQGLDSADIIINLKFNNIFTQWIFILKRHLKRKNETITGLFKLMKHVLYKRYKLGYKKNVLTVDETIEPYRYKVITLCSFKEIDDFVDSL